MADGDGPAEAQSGDGRLLAGRYRLVSVVGRGGMGTVWRARDEMLGREVAVKEVLLRSELSDSEREERHHRTLREARASARLNHPGVVTVHDVVDEDDRPWIVMELVRARSVQEILDADGPLPAGRVAAIGRQLVGALRAAHAIGILHRDVKPANVLLTDDDRAILTDFGIARVAGDATLTRTGLLVGSPAYMAPERVRGERAMPASDLWALGATLYAACEGRPPHHHGETMAVLAAIMTKDPPPPRNAGGLGPVLYGLLRRDPADRLRAERAEEMLKQVAAGNAGPAGPAAATPSWQAAGEPAAGTAALPGPPAGPNAGSPPAASPYDGRTAGPAATAPSKRSSAAWLVLAAAMAAAVTVVVGAVVFWPDRGKAGGASATPTASTRAGSAPTGPVRNETGRRPGGTGTTPPLAAPPSMPAGFARVRLHGYSIGLPHDWVREERGNSTFWLDPESDAYVQVDRTRWTGDPYEHWVRWEREVRAKNALEGFRRIGLRRTSVGGRPAAEIEFAWSGFRAVDRGVIAEGRPFAVLVAVPASRWNEYQPTVNNVLNTFQP